MIKAKSIEGTNEIEAEVNGNKLDVLAEYVALTKALAESVDLNDETDMLKYARKQIEKAEKKKKKGK